MKVGVILYRHMWLYGLIMESWRHLDKQDTFFIFPNVVGTYIVMGFRVYFSTSQIFGTSARSLLTPLAFVYVHHTSSSKNMCNITHLHYSTYFNLPISYVSLGSSRAARHTRCCNQPETAVLVCSAHT